MVISSESCPWSLTLNEIWNHWKLFVLSRGKQGPYPVFNTGLTCCVVGVIGLVLLS